MIHQHRYTRHYGSPRMAAERKERGFAVGRKRVARLMRELGICIRPQRKGCKTTDSRHPFAVSNNQFARDFAPGPRDQRAWVGDITYLQSPKGFLYLATVLDVSSRRLLGYALAIHMQSSLVLEALQMALCHEGTAPELWHSDRGSQYASGDYRKALSDRGITLRMSAKGDCYDNAVAERFFATFKREVADTFASLRDAEREVFDFDLFCNRVRKHSSLGYLCPADYAAGLGGNTSTELTLAA